MIILGIDPGYGRTGYGVIGVDGAKTSYIAAGCIETSKDAALEQRLLHIYDDLERIIQSERPDALALEKLFFAKNAKTALRVAETRGIILLLSIKKGLALREFTPLEVKMAVCGYGRAEKSQVQYMVAKILNIPSAPKPDDAADALAIAITAAAYRRPV